MPISAIITALVGKQLTFPDGTRVVIMGNAVYHINKEGKFVRLKIEPFIKEPMIKTEQPKGAEEQEMKA